MIAIIDDIILNGDDDYERRQRRADRRVVRERTNFDMVGDSFLMRFRLTAERVQWLHQQVGMHLRPVQPYHHALSTQQKLLILIRLATN
jgi:hypothetical protein